MGRLPSWGWELVRHWRMNSSATGREISPKQGCRSTSDIPPSRGHRDPQLQPAPAPSKARGAAPHGSPAAGQNPSPATPGAYTTQIEDISAQSELRGRTRDPTSQTTSSFADQSKQSHGFHPYTAGYFAAPELLGTPELMKSRSHRGRSYPYL